METQKFEIEITAQAVLEESGNTLKVHKDGIQLGCLKASLFPCLDGKKEWKGQALIQAIGSYNLVISDPYTWGEDADGNRGIEVVDIEGVDKDRLYISDAFVILAKDDEYYDEIENEMEINDEITDVVHEALESQEL